MAPEQLLGEVSQACDQYALGVCVYEWISGRLPFRGADRAELLDQHLFELPPALSKLIPGFAPAVEQVILRALAKRPEQRFETVAAFARALTDAVTEDMARPQAVQLGKKLVTSEKVTKDMAKPRAVQPHERNLAPAALPAPAREQQPSPGEVIASPPVPEALQIWNVPYHRNPCFTGREALLARVHDLLCHPGPLNLPLALCGLGGMGKTQLAVEYAYRYAATYSAVYFVRGESHETLLNDFLALARLLNLPEDPDIQHVASLVQNWLAQTAPTWLLILDNVEDLATLEAFLPRAGREHVLLTTRAQVTGAATCVEVDDLFEEEAALLLLRRAGSIRSTEDYSAVPRDVWRSATTIVRLLDGLPLALDQAGAYIEETHCTLDDYQEQYQQQNGVTLLQRRGERAERDHPEPVATTWALSFQKVEGAHPAAADLLQLCAFLDPLIPEEMILGAGQHLGPALAQAVGDPLQVAEMYHELRRYSLVRYDPETRTLRVHRLVQTVVREAMELGPQRQWAERAIRCVNQTFPKSEDVTAWPRAERLVAHIDRCIELVDAWCCVLPEAARLFNEAGLYFRDHARYQKAEELLRRAVEMRTVLYGTDHAETAESLNDLGTLLFYQQRAHEAEPYFRRALTLKMRAHGPFHPDVAIACNNLAMVSRDQGQFAEAEVFFRQALAIWQQESRRSSSPGKDAEEHMANVARTLNNLGLLSVSQGKQAEAEPLFLQALALWEQGGGATLHPDAGRTLNNLGKLYRNQGRMVEAEQLLVRARAVREQSLGPDHPDVAQTQADLALLYVGMGRTVEAEELFALALEILEQVLGEEHPRTRGVRQQYEKVFSSS